VNELTILRDTVWTRIGIKKVAAQFTYANDFTHVRTWRPWETLESLKANHPHGKCYVITGTPGTKVNESRANSCLAEFNVMVGFQHIVANIDDMAELDQYVHHVEELDQMCRKEIDVSSLDPLFSWVRTDYIRDPDGIPYNFVGLRDAHTFEAYFTAFYSTVLP
jgi:hypothetical protein